MLNGPVQNTDREIWRSSHKVTDMTTARICVTQRDSIVIEVSGSAIGLTIENWYQAGVTYEQIYCNARKSVSGWRHRLACWLLGL